MNTKGSLNYHKWTFVLALYEDTLFSELAVVVVALLRNTSSLVHEMCSVKRRKKDKQKKSNFRRMVVHVIDIIESVVGLSTYRSFLSDLFDTSPLNALLYWCFFLVLGYE